jgi:hypothetical protein
MSQHVLDYFATSSTFLQHASGSAAQQPTSSVAHAPSSSAAQLPPSSVDATAGAVDAALLQSMREALGSTADSPCSMLTILNAAADTHNSTGGGGSSDSSSANSSRSDTGCRGRLGCGQAADALQIEGAVQQLGCGSMVVTPNGWFQLPGSEHSSTRPRDMRLTFPALLQEASGNSSDAR